MRNLATAAAVLAAAVVVVANGSAKPGPPRPAMDVVGHVYVDDNTAGENTVAGFDRHSDGSLTPMPGSPFDVGGAGGGHGNASQGSLQLSDDGRYLLAVDAGSNQISVLRIKPDGSLQQAEGSPVDSGGANPVSIAVSGNLVYVANQGPGVSPGDANYTGFMLNSGGHLRPIPGSTYALPSDAVPGEVLFNGDGSRLVGTRIGTSAIDSFTVGTDGQSDRGAGLAVPRQGVHAPAGVRPARERVQPEQPGSAVRVGRPYRGRRPRLRPGLELHRRPARRPHADRRLARRQRRHGVVLGRDQQGRHVSVRREHCVDDGLELLDRARRVDRVSP